MIKNIHIRYLSSNIYFTDDGHLILLNRLIFFFPTVFSNYVLSWMLHKNKHVLVYTVVILIEKFGIKWDFSKLNEFKCNRKLCCLKQSLSRCIFNVILDCLSWICITLILVHFGIPNWKNVGSRKISLSFLMVELSL